VAVAHAAIGDPARRLRRCPPCRGAFVFQDLSGDFAVTPARKRDCRHGDGAPYLLGVAISG